MFDQQPARRFVSSTDTAKLLRAQLKREFPGVKFSVRTDKYAGGASIRVEWVDGPRASRVEAVAGVFAGGRFDGMIDLAYGVEHFLHADGSVSLAHDAGTGGSRGSCPEVFGDPLDGSAELVRFGADYVFCTRQLSDGFVALCAAAACASPGGDAGVCDRCRVGFDGGYYVDRERGGFFRACSAECAARLFAPGVDSDDVVVHAAAIVEAQQ